MILSYISGICRSCDKCHSLYFYMASFHHLVLDIFAGILAYRHDMILFD